MDARPGALSCRYARMGTALVVCLCAAAASACSHAQAKTVPEPPPLEMPPPPPRSVDATAPEAPPPIGLPTEPARNNLVEASRSELNQRADTTRSGELAKPETAVESPAKAVEETARSSPPPTLQTTRAQQEAEVERSVRVLLTRAANDLKRINYRALNADARAQYDTARRFMSQAEDALRVKNLVFADNLADKAATLAAQLASR